MSLRPRFRLAGCMLALAASMQPACALGQTSQCRLPDSVTPGAPPRQSEPTVQAPIASYTLAVSWSPGFCRSHREAADSMQCSGSLGRFGFVLHGLWPEAGNGPSPQWCASRPRPSADLLRRNLCMTPSAGLLEHEWARHGTCMSKTPEAYFNSAQRLWQALHWPDAAQMSYRADLTAGDLRRAIADANPGWRSDQIGLLVNPDGWLQELRLCYTAGIKPTGCAPSRLGPPDSAPLKIWRGR